MLLLSQASFAQQDVNIIMDNPSTCIEDKLYYNGGSQIYKCVNGEEVPYKYCPYGAVGGEKEEWVCANNPASCVSERKVVYEGEHCCNGLVEGDDGICIERQVTSPFLIILLLVVVALIVWVIFRKRK